MSLWLLLCLFSDNRHSVATNSLVTHRRWNVITCMWNVQVVFHAFSKLQPYSGREMCILRMLLLLLRWSLVSVCAAVSICWCYAVVQFVSFICHTYTYVVVYWHWWANIQGATPHPPAASRSGKNDANSWFSLAMVNALSFLQCFDTAGRVCSAWSRGTPFLPFSCLVHSLRHLLLFFYFFPISFSHSLYLFSSFVRPSL